MDTPLVPRSIGRVTPAPAKAAWLWGMIGAALLLGPSASPGAIGTAVALTFVTVCLGHSVGLHRGLIHETYRMPRPLRNVLLYLFVHTGLGGPLSWILLHHVRDHWQNQRETPRYFAYRHSLARDFWWNLHCRFEPRDVSLYGVSESLSRDPWLRFLERTWALHVLALALVLAAAFGPGFAATAVFARVAVAVLGHWFVGFVAHKYGEIRWELDGSTEVGRNTTLLLGWLSFGEGFHNNHHAHPGSARMGFRWYELDLGWIVVRAMEAAGLVTGVRAFGRGMTRRPNARHAGQPVRPGQLA